MGIMVIFGFSFYVGVVLLFLFLIRKLPFINKIKESKYYIFSGIFTVIMISLPYWDMIIQKVIKYDLEKENNIIIYEYPEKNKDGLYEGLYIPKEFKNFGIKDYTKYSFLEKNEKYNFRTKNKTLSTKYKDKNIRIYYEDDRFELMNIKKSRYEIEIKKDKTKYYIKEHIKYYDRKTNILLAENYSYEFPPVGEERDKLRYWLLWNFHGSTGSIVTLFPIINNGKTFNQLFK